MKRKIFVLGLTHTGKNSLDAALEKLGYIYKHYPYPDKVLELARQFDVLSDTPVIPFMEKLDALYPDARFIITVRDMKSWLESCQSHWKRRPKREPMQMQNRKRIYGIMYFDPKIFEKVYRKHLARVIEYFKDRPGKLLVIDICGGEGYKELCAFLDVPVIEEKFPHRNRDKPRRK